MKALTILQPWAHAIMHLGKNVENRTWATSHRGPMVVHVGKSRTWLERERASEWPALYGVALPLASAMPFGAIVGIVDVVACVQLGELGYDHPGRRWAFGPWCWVLANPRPLGPIPWKGQMGLFDVPDDVLKTGEQSESPGLFGA